jgi:hypothetical protein
MWMTLATLASAGEWKPQKPYVLPRLDASVIAIGGTTLVQARGGADAGVLVRYSEDPFWLSNTRLGVTGILGLTTLNYGGDIRLGSFFGPDWELLRIQLGPDVWYNGYGDPTASDDYYLPWAPGLDLPLTAEIAREEKLSLLTAAIPGWAFSPERSNTSLDVVDELTLLAALSLRLPHFGVTAGYQRTWNAAGLTEGLILSFGL